MNNARTNTELSPEQQYAFSQYLKGENLFITGPGGTGKSRLIQYIVEHATNTNRKFQVCALTGCAAILLKCKAKTIHSWSGIKLARGTKESVIRQAAANSTAKKAWKSTTLLIVDEVSMMSVKIFEILVELASYLNPMNRHVFGGIQVIFTGDFYQLPPVGNADEPETSMFCFESPDWNRVFKRENHIELKTMFRQTDPLYIKVLEEARVGKLSQSSCELLQTYVKRVYNPDENNGFVPTKLFAVRSKTDFVNQSMFAKIPNATETFDCIQKEDCLTYLDTGKAISTETIIYCRSLTREQREREIDALMTNSQCVKKLNLKKGASIMLTYNLDVDIGLCNGAQGVITDFIIRDNGQKLPVVRFTNGIVTTIEHKYYQSEDVPTIAIGQLPICLAWALTIHKIQGATLSTAEMDLGSSVFEYGQAYVALSRVQSLEGLYLINFLANKIKAHPKVIEFYKTIPSLPMITAPAPSPISPSNIDFEQYKYTERENAPVLAIPIETSNNIPIASAIIVNEEEYEEAGKVISDTSVATTTKVIRLDGTTTVFKVRKSR
jgi:ATP-dependent DNA helicase PIF1